METLLTNQVGFQQNNEPVSESGDREKERRNFRSLSYVLDIKRMFLPLDCSLTLVPPSVLMSKTSNEFLIINI